MRKIYILIFMHIVSVISAQGGNITVMDATIDDSRYYMASTMKEMISAEYTGEIRYDGSNHRLVFIDVKADITTLNYHEQVVNLCGCSQGKPRNLMTLIYDFVNQGFINC